MDSYTLFSSFRLMCYITGIFFPPGATTPIGGCIFTALLRPLASSLARFLDHIQRRATVGSSGLPRNFFFRGGGGSTNSIEDRGQRGRGSGGGSPLVRGSGGSCNLVQEISFHIVKFS